MQPSEVEDAMPPTVSSPTQCDRSRLASAAIVSPPDAGLFAGVTWMMHLRRDVWPRVDASLAQWQVEAEAIPDGHLRAQALASIAHKKFHCEGGAVYALFCRPAIDTLVPLIVALQTISDYLDCLSDRGDAHTFAELWQLHTALIDAVQPDAPVRTYYAHHCVDGGYLQRLVQTCQQCIRALPMLDLVGAPLLGLIEQYCMLQSTKHVHKDERERLLRDWAQSEVVHHPGIVWQEYAACAGSTLGWFALLALAADRTATEHARDALLVAYVPHVCALHILLDYVVDREEDELGGDLNFCAYYDDDAHVAMRLRAFVQRSHALVRTLPAAKLHAWIVDGLLALYLSDPKVRRQPWVRDVARNVVWRGGATRTALALIAKWKRWRSGRSALDMQAQAQP
ncbi:MAG: tetraprenyl-beta-curcumene synthase family protein [Paenibacillaceae bacterium]|nr:tetraprenyl-beta-curcumene synthase family protein [Paenibacillaceae bacterium]